MSELTQSEYATARGWSAAYVSKLKRQGRLVVTKDGKVNVEATDRLIENTRDPARGGDRRPAPGCDVPDAGAEQVGHAAARGKPAARGEEGDSAYREAARRERIAKARLAELELAEAAGQLVRREEVDRVLFGLSRQAMDALLSMSERLAGRCAAEHDEFRVAALIDAEVRKIADQLARGPALLDEASGKAGAEEAA